MGRRRRRGKEDGIAYKERLVLTTFRPPAKARVQVGKRLKQSTPQSARYLAQTAVPWETTSLLAELSDSEFNGTRIQTVEMIHSRLRSQTTKLQPFDGGNDQAQTCLWSGAMTTVPQAAPSLDIRLGLLCVLFNFLVPYSLYGSSSGQKAGRGCRRESVNL